MQTSAVQTYLGKKASELLSEKVKSIVRIGSVDIDLMKQITISDIYIEDLHHDTLLYSEKLKVDFDKIDLKNQRIVVKKIKASGTAVEYKKYLEDEDFNIQFLIDAFDSGDTTKKASSPKWDILCKNIEFENGGFVYVNEHDTVITNGFNHVDIRVKDINGNFNNLTIDNDTAIFYIANLSAIEKSGFGLNDLKSKVKLSPVSAIMTDLSIKTPNSNIIGDLTFKYSHNRDFNRFVSKVKIESTQKKSIVSMKDIAYFAPELKGMDEKITVSGKVTGKVNDLRGDNIELKILNNTYFKGDFALTGLPDIEETLIHLNADEVATTYNDLIKIPLPPFDKNKTLELAPNISKLGKMSFKGTFTGLYNDFYAYGKFTSDLGNLSSDLALRHDYQTNKKTYKGKLTSQSFDFGVFFGIPELGTATAKLDIDGTGLTVDEITASLNGEVYEVLFNKYNYKNITVTGNFAKQIFKGKLNINDENILMDFNGDVDFTGEKPNLDFISTIEKADLNALNFVKTKSKTNLSTQIFIDVTGSNIDNLVGKIHLDNTIYKKDGKTYKMNSFNLTANESNQQKTIKLFSDFADGEISGKFKILELHESAKYILKKYLPAYISSKLSEEKLPLQNFTYDITVKKANNLTELFIPELTVSPSTKINGVFNTTKNEFSLKILSNKVTYNNITLTTWNIDAVTAPSSLVFFSSCKKLSLNDSLWFGNFNLITNTNNDSLHLSTNWENKTAPKNSGDIKAYIHFSSSDIIWIKFLKSQFTIADSVWSIDENNFTTIDSNRININNLSITNINQGIIAHGAISKNKNEQLKLKLNNFNLDNLNLLTRNYDLNIKGKAHGEATVSDLYNNTILLSDTQFENLYINNNEIGKGVVQSIWDKSKEGVFLDGKFSLGLVPNILFSGHYYPKRENNNLDFNINLQALQMQIFEPYVKKYCSSFKGFFAGKIDLKGTFENPLLNGKIDVNAKKVTVDYLNTTYKFSQPVIVENNSFGIENFEILDANNNKAIANGKVYHTNFKNFQLDFDIYGDKFMCLNTTEKDNELFYGKGFVTGYINIFGFTDNILIEANVKTEKLTPNDKLSLKSNTEYTKFYIPLTGTSEVGENDFIRFVKKDTISNSSNEYKVELDGLTLDFSVEVTPDAELQLIFDQKVGDIIKTTGKGNVKLQIDSRGKFKMYGDYMIEDGDYLFTLQNIINKRFAIENGSTIKWTGEPGNAQVNINAIYKARASLSPFFPADETIVDKKRHPVDLKLLMTENLASPAINFEIQLPQNIDSRVKQEVMSYLNNDAELNRQVFSLMILNSFVTPYQLSSGGGGGANALTAAEANSTELLSNQLSNMLSKISNDFDIGVNYRPGDEITKDELEVALSTQLFNDRLSVDGNFGVNSNNANPEQSQNTNNLVGDVSVEYKITDDGKFRVKAFNKANDNNQLTTYGGYTQGIGFFYRKEFDTIGELFNRYLKKVSGDEKKKKS